MPHLALYTFGVLKAPLADPAPVTREFHDSAGPIYQKIAQHPGYLGHAEAVNTDRRTYFDSDWGAWGEFAVPGWYGKGHTLETTALAASLSLWTDQDSAFDALYTGLHRAALNRRYDWFERSGRPSHVLWWVFDGAIPTWQEGVSRLERLHDHGPAPHAFTFHRSFAPDGTPAGLKGIGPKSDRAR
ncbi:DUF3291 domain-containing protein [Streptomyces sp. SDr-06]|uniref:DUF3291 domain-containing protein n=1 Tax=Streptomyces sp. SDr-06 TaxID=2267702 RepID=UPI000DEB629B|nr:DUF3291 domain-containing protein [Streptomyces sp. SDr-06]RCH65735.1 DUF3291 domain-containing protein [Streptomyces sp. SDr-06]